MKTITVDVESRDYELSVGVSELSKLETTYLAAKAPDSLLALDPYSTDRYDLTPEMLDYFVDVLENHTNLNKDTVENMDRSEMMEISAAVLEEIFEDNDNSQDDSRRLKRVRATEEWVEMLFKGKVTLVAGMPDDASLENFNYDPSRNEMQFIFSSSEWDKIAEGGYIPEVDASVVEVPFDDPRDVK